MCTVNKSIPIIKVTKKPKFRVIMVGGSFEIETTKDRLYESILDYCIENRVIPTKIIDYMEI